MAPWPGSRVPLVFTVAAVLLIALGWMRPSPGLSFDNDSSSWKPNLKGIKLPHMPSMPSMSIHSSACPHQKPNLILSALSGPHMLDTVFIYIQSLDIALGKAALAAQIEHRCGPADVVVRIMMPLSVANSLPQNFLALQRRYPYLQFIGGIPETGGNIQVTRFEGWATFSNKTWDEYGNILSIDLDVIFQRNPFTMPLPSGAEIMFVREWRGYKIKQCWVHRDWFVGCRGSAGGTYMTQQQVDNLMPFDRICSGSTYGTARAMAVYLQLMAAEERRSGGGCIDQATHIHLYYNGLLDEALSQKGFGRVWAASEEESLIGTVGTTPVIRYNEWGEMLTELGEVMAVVHQFKHNEKLFSMVHKRYAWFAPLKGVANEPIPKLVVDKKWNEDNPDADIPRWRLEGIDNSYCDAEDSLCACRIPTGEYACQWSYPS